MQTAVNDLYNNHKRQWNNIRLIFFFFIIKHFIKPFCQNGMI